MTKPFHAEIEFQIGEIVYLRTADSEEPGLVVELHFMGSRHHVTYGVAFGTYTSTHYAMELVREYTPKYPENEE